jgi:ribosomal protein S18 acetylase RimI-like enzyme
VPRSITEADVPAVVELINEATPEALVDEAEVRRWLTNPAQDIEFALFERDGELLAYADIGLSEETPDRGWIDIRVPARFVAEDLLDEAIDWSEGVARARGRALVRAVAVGGSPLVAHLERRGYSPIRFSFEMRIDLDERLPTPALPNGVQLTSLRPGEERVAYAVSQEAFADHWEFTPHSWEEWSHFMIGDDFDPELWIVSRDGDEVAGVCLCRSEAIGRPGVGYVRILGVRRPWRRRGLGRALLLEAFRRFGDRGAHAVALGVDGENTTGAVRLYESVGMRVEHRADIYERSLD